MSSVDVRVRRPREHEMLVQRMRDEAGFPTMRDVLLLAAAIGASRKRRRPFQDSSEPIRYETLTDPNFAGTLVNMIAAVAIQDDAEILEGIRLSERLRVFEEYANGGLDVIQEEVNARRTSLDLVVAELVVGALADTRVSRPVTVEELLGAVE